MGGGAAGCGRQDNANYKINTIDFFLAMLAYSKVLLILFYL